MARPQEPPPSHRPGVAQVVAALVADVPGLRTGKTFGHPAFFAGPKLFAFVYRESVVLKLPVTTLERLRGQPGCTPFTMGGKVMREWVQIRRDSAEAYKADRGLLHEAAAFVSSATGAARKKGSRIVRKAQ